MEVAFLGLSEVWFSEMRVKNSPLLTFCEHRMNLVIALSLKTYNRHGDNLKQESNSNNATYWSEQLRVTHPQYAALCPLGRALAKAMSADRISFDGISCRNCSWLWVRARRRLAATLARLQEPRRVSRLNCAATHAWPAKFSTYDFCLA